MLRRFWILVKFNVKLSTEVNLKISGQWALQDLDCRYGGIEEPMPRSAVRSWLRPPFTNKLGVSHLLESNLTTAYTTICFCSPDFGMPGHRMSLA